MTSPLILQATRYVRQGFSVIPIKTDGSKSPKFPGWRQYAVQLPTDEELVDWFASGEAGIGIPCGPASGNLVILDFEHKHDINAHDVWLAKLPEHLKQVALGLPRVATPSGGRHLYVRLPEAQPGCVLARYADRSVMIEVRGEGHQVVAPGSPLACHPSGKPYEWHVSPEDGSLEALDIDTFLDLVEVAEQCSQFAKPEAPEYKSASGRTNGTATDDSPGTDFNRRGTWAETGLFECGWQWVRETADDVGYLTRPGKGSGVSASVGIVNSERNGWPLFFVWSTSTDFEAETPYNRFAVFAKLKHNADFKAAAKALAALGYGKPDPEPIFGDGPTKQHQQHQQQKPPHTERNARTEARTELDLVCMADVTPCEVPWLWVLSRGEDTTAGQNNQDTQDAPVDSRRCPNSDELEILRENLEENGQKTPMNCEDAPVEVNWGIFAESSRSSSAFSNGTYSRRHSAPTPPPTPEMVFLVDRLRDGKQHLSEDINTTRKKAGVGGLTKAVKALSIIPRETRKGSGKFYLQLPCGFDLSAYPEAEPMPEPTLLDNIEEPPLTETSSAHPGDEPKPKRRKRSPKRKSAAKN